MESAPREKTGFELRLLGEIEVVRDGRVCPLPASRKTRALLGYLAATARPHLREQLCDLLWEGPDDPRASLRWSLAKLRPLVDDRTVRLVADRTHVGFEPRAARIDRVEARRLATASPESAPIESLRAAATLLRGELLEGLDLPDCYRYHEWWTGERDAARSLRISVLDALVARLRDDVPDEALKHARDRLGIDPLSEAAHATVARLLARLGRRPEALAQYETGRRILEQQLHAKPSWVLESVRVELAAPPAVPPKPAAPHKIAKRPPLVGRRSERAELLRHVQTAAAGSGGVVLLVSGEAGIGKSRLLEEVRAATEAAAGITIAGRGFEAEMVRAYGAIIDALRTLPRERLRGAPRELARLLPELGGEQSPEKEGDRARLFEAVVTFLRGLASATPLALVVDDVQWLDEASIALLHYVARGLGDDRIVIACSVRKAELADNRAALRFVRALEREPHVHGIELGPLAPDEVQALALSAGARDAAAVGVRSGGNPFYAIELARAGATGDDATLPSTLASLVAARFDGLQEPARALLPIAAALGRAFDVSLLACVAATDETSLLPALADLEDHDVLRAGGTDGGALTYDFAHDLVRQAAYQAPSESRRRMVHLQIARALAPRIAGEGCDDALAVDVAHHAARGGDAELAARACVVAAQRCLRMYARDEAEALAVRGLAQAERLPMEKRLAPAIALLGTRVFAGTDRRRTADVESMLTRLAGEAARRRMPDEASSAYQALSIIRHERGDMEGAHRDMMQAAAEARGGDPLVEARVLAHTAACLIELEREPQRARTLLEKARGVAERHRVELGDVWIGLGALSSHEGDLDAARPQLQRAFAVAEAEQDGWRRFWSLRRLYMVDLEAGRFADARRSAVTLAELARQSGDESDAAIAAMAFALAEYGLGSEGCDEALDRALAGLRKVDAKQMLAYASIFASERLAARGALDDAEKHARAALAAAEVVKRENLVALAHVALATVALARGDSSTARAHVERAAGTLPGRETPSARTRDSVARIASAVGIELSIVAPTVAHTEPS